MEDNRPMTPDELREALIVQILSVPGTTREEVLESLKIEKTMSSLRIKIEAAVIQDERLESIGPNKSLTALSLLFQQGLIKIPQNK